MHKLQMVRRWFFHPILAWKTAARLRWERNLRVEQEHQVDELKENFRKMSKREIESQVNDDYRAMSHERVESALRRMGGMAVSFDIVPPNEPKAD